MLISFTCCLFTLPLTLSPREVTAKRFLYNPGVVVVSPFSHFFQKKQLHVELP